MKIDSKTNEATRVNKGGYDDDYIYNYVNDPKAGRSEALRLAGYVGDYLTQEASRIHKRLASRIHQAFTDKIKLLEGKAIQQIESMLDLDAKTVGYSNMRAICKDAMEFAGRKPADVIEVKAVKTVDDLDANIERLQQEIAQTEGKTEQVH